MLEANEMKLLRKTVSKTKIDRIKSQKIRESCGIRPINAWVERRRRKRERYEYVTRMDVERLVKISRKNYIYLPEEDLQDALQEYGER